MRNPTWRNSYYYRVINIDLTVVRWSSAIWQSRWQDDLEHWPIQVCSVSHRTSHRGTVETLCQCSHLWWLAALNSYSHRTLSLRPNSTPNHRCRNSTARRSPSNISTPPLCRRRPLIGTYSLHTRGNIIHGVPQKNMSWRQHFTLHVLFSDSP